MSNWNPGIEWRRLKLVTEAVSLYETSADWDAGYGDAQGNNKAEKEAKEAAEEAADAKKTKIKYWGDLHDILDAIAHAKELKSIEKRGGEVGKAAATILSYFPGGDAFVKWAGTPAKFIKDKKKPLDQIKQIMGTVKPIEDEKLEKPAGGFLDAFKIDDGYQKITDDKLENKFIKDISAEFAEKPRDEEIPPDMDINDWYEKWLSENIGDTDETVTGAESDKKFTDINAISPDAKKSKNKKNVQKVGKFIKGGLKSFLGF